MRKRVSDALGAENNARREFNLGRREEQLLDQVVDRVRAAASSGLKVHLKSGQAQRVESEIRRIKGLGDIKSRGQAVLRLLQTISSAIVGTDIRSGLARIYPLERQADVSFRRDERRLIRD